MYKRILFAAGLLALPLASNVKADDGAKVYYKDGTRIETSDFDMKINVKIQPKFSYKDNDSEARREADLPAANDSTSFDLRRVELLFSGNLLNKAFSYKVKTDLRSDSGGSQLKDA